MTRLEIMLKEHNSNYTLLYRKELKDWLGNTNASIMLGQLIYWHFKMGGEFYKFKEPSENNHFYKVGESWCEELGFTPKELRTAIDKIKEKGLLTTRCDGSNLIWWQLDIEKIEQFYIDLEYIDISQGQRGMPKRAEQSAQKGKADCLKGQSELPKKANPIHIYKEYTETTSENTQKSGDLFCETPKPKNSKRFLEMSDKPACISSEVWADWIQHKKELKDDFKELGIKSLKTRYENLSKKGYDINELMIEAISRGWHDIVVRDLPHQNSFKKRETTMEELDERNKQHIAEVHAKMEKAAAEYGIDPDLLKNYDPALERSDDF